LFIATILISSDGFIGIGGTINFPESQRDITKRVKKNREIIDET
jgi:hypothetical protein